MPPKISFFKTFEEALWRLDLELSLTYAKGQWTVTIWSGDAAKKQILCITRADRKLALETAAIALLSAHPQRYAVRLVTQEQAEAAGLHPMTEYLTLEDIRPVSAQMGTREHAIIKAPPRPGASQRFQLWSVKMPSKAEQGARSIQKMPDAVPQRIRNDKASRKHA